jgi:Spy/CpxP family protein refolding chaperone
MMHTRSLVIALIVALVAPAAAFAQGGGQGRGGPGGPGGLMAARLLLDQGSVEFLITKAAELRLTDEQTAALKTIGAQWSAETKSSRDEVRAALPAPGQAGGGDRQAMMERFQALMPVMQKLRDEDQKALDAALELLDASQQAAAKKLIEERSPARRPQGM